MSRFTSRHGTARLIPQCLAILRTFPPWIAFIGLCSANPSQTAAELYSQAEQLYEQGDPYRAAPLFAEAEQQFRSVGDRRDELAAKFGRLRADADHGHYKSVKSEVERDFATPMVQSDPRLKIQALSLLGIIDLNIDTVAANSDWTQVLNVATASGDLKWQNRARGELGIVAGLKGDRHSRSPALQGYFNSRTNGRCRWRNQF